MIDSEITFVAIDPGANGAIATLPRGGDVTVHRIPDTPEAMYVLFRDLCRNPCRTLLENVGYYRPGNSGPASCTFARHCGYLEMAVIATGSELIKVVPRVWMSKLFGSNLPEEKSERKEYIYQQVQHQLFPGLHGIKKFQADALGMLYYLMLRNIPTRRESYG